MAIGDAIALYTTTLTPTSAQLEAEWSSSWRSNTLTEEAPYLFSELKLDGAYVNPWNLKLYVRDRAGRWSLSGSALSLTSAPDPADGSYQDAARFVGNGCSGWVWASDQAGTAICTRSRVV